MEQFLIDTNVISDFLSLSLSPKGISFLSDIIDEVPNISVITQIELLCWNADERITGKVTSFVEDSNVFDISPEIVQNCVKIRKGKKVKTPDAIIAATALSYGYTLVTNNEKDFKHIADLKVVNPHLL